MIIEHIPAKRLDQKNTEDVVPSSVVPLRNRMLIEVSNPPGLELQRTKINDSLPPWPALSKPNWAHIPSPC